VAATVIGVVALTILRRLERKRDDTLQRRVTLVLDEGTPPLATLLAGLTAKGIAIVPAEYEKRLDEQRIHVTFQARVPKDLGDHLLEHLEGVSGVRRIRIEPGAN